MRALSYDYNRNEQTPRSSRFCCYQCQVYIFENIFFEFPARFHEYICMYTVFGNIEFNLFLLVYILFVLHVLYHSIYDIYVCKYAGIRAVRAFMSACHCVCVNIYIHTCIHTHMYNYVKNMHMYQN